MNVTSTTLDSTANYSCNSGYNLVGTATVTCTTSGEWSDGAPTCQCMCPIHACAFILLWFALSL